MIIKTLGEFAQVKKESPKHALLGKKR